jgi:hypothetical protein
MVSRVSEWIRQNHEKGEMVDAASTIALNPNQYRLGFFLPATPLLAGFRQFFS